MFRILQYGQNKDFLLSKKRYRSLYRTAWASVVRLLHLLTRCPPALVRKSRYRQCHNPYDQWHRSLWHYSLLPHSLCDHSTNTRTPPHSQATTRTPVDYHPWHRLQWPTRLIRTMQLSSPLNIPTSPINMFHNTRYTTHLEGSIHLLLSPAY